MRKKVVILGATGMLGSMILDFFSKDSNFNIKATYRDKTQISLLKNKYPKVNFSRFDVEKVSEKDILSTFDKTTWIINAIGIIKPHIHDDNEEEIRRAIFVNAYFPHILAAKARKIDAKIIQIATDCVYSGQKGKYTESDNHDATDVYGKTKSLGEVYESNVCHLRCSIIGPELKVHQSLLDWFLAQPKKGEINGFTNHLWNGITTLHFAKICKGIIENNINLPHLQHIIPGNVITKANLLKTFSKEFNRKDLTIKNTKAPIAIDRTLSTNNIELNNKLWKLSGYASSPNIEEMIKELASYQL